MPDLKDGESAEMQGSGKKPYILKNTAGVYSCSCPAWRNQSVSIDKRTCKHLIKYRGEEAEKARTNVGDALPRKDVVKKETAPPVLLAEAWDGELDPTGWLMSEKLDGVRAWWDGKNFISRLGNIYHAPEWFKKGLPATVLDGELFTERKQFNQTVSIVRRLEGGDEWTKVTYLVFDVPTRQVAFKMRYDEISNQVKKAKYARRVAHQTCLGADHLKEYLELIERQGGEGVMIRDPNALYEAGRSRSLLKVKSFFDDDAVVVGHVPGKGRHRGRLGALAVRLASGIEFEIGTGLSDKQREDPPPIGSTVTFKYTELTKDGVPRFASYQGVRAD